MCILLYLFDNIKLNRNGLVSSVQSGLKGEILSREAGRGGQEEGGRGREVIGIGSIETKELIRKE